MLSPTLSQESTSVVSSPLSSVDDVYSVEELYRRITVGEESFWDVVYPVFMSRDITNSDMRELLDRGLREVGGYYKVLNGRFHSSPDQYKKLMNFLRKHKLLLDFRRYRN